MVVRTVPGAKGEKEPGAEKPFELSGKPRRLTLAVPNTEELENLADELKLSTPARHHRLPALTFLRFDFENSGTQVWTLELSRIKVTGAGGESYGIVDARAYAARFTSVAYEHFTYDAMYSTYITTRAGAKPKDGVYFAKHSPQESLVIRPGEAGFAILPIEFIPSGVEAIRLTYPVEVATDREFEIKLVTERGS